MLTCTSDPTQDLGHSITVEIRRIDGEIEGLEYTHPCLGGSLRQGWIPLNTKWGNQAWTLVSESPLTLTPSLLCPVCKHHGFIREGRWVPA